MLPTLRPGDRLQVDTRAYRDGAPRVGDIVVLVDPADPARWLVKRVSAVSSSAGTVDVQGDASATARDSRHFGPVPLRALVGRVYRCYYPRGRRRDF